jgi:peptidoglycan/LPS O-acetylase OafA/YrhL
MEQLLGHTIILSKFLMPVFGIWAGVYMMGYVIDEAQVSSKMRLRWYIAGGSLIVLFGLVFVLVPQQSLSSSGNPLPAWNDMLSAVFYPVVAAALYLFFKNIKIAGDKMKKAVEFVGNRAFGIYLIHFCFYFSYRQLLPEWLRGADGAVEGIAKRVIITTIVYLASLAVATLVDILVVNPVQKQLKSRLFRA